ncbi:hypothetical protein [Gelidibacter japonicus]|uniref:hypothetical protein n=1 Tax=Gelidibacter japonicus TaxID=1962232 RepID=UPI002AFDD33D|nr:hypothetical protein [Gelidibacter japonicus]
MDKAQKGYLILLFLLSPFIGLLNLFKLKNEKDITFFGTLFFGLVGSVFVYVEGTDGSTHLTQAKEYYSNMSLVEFFKKAYEILTFSSIEGATDIYLHCLSYVSSSILQIPELIHVFAGFVLGYFFIKSVLLVLKNNLRSKKSYILIGFIVLFLLIKSIGALNSIRMWTGMWILFYGTYSWAITKEKKYLYVILFSIFVHFSYAVILIPVIAAYALQKQKRVLVTLYILSFFATVGFSFFAPYIPESDLLANKQSIYTIDSDEDSERYELKTIDAKQVRQSQTFYKAFGEVNYLNYSIVGLSLILVYFYFDKNADLKLNFLIAVGMGLYAFANIVAFSPGLQGRTKAIAALFILAAAIHLQLTLRHYRISLRKLNSIRIGLVLFLISAIPMFLFQISYIFQNISFFSLLFPQISWYLGDADYSIRTAIGLLTD